MLTDGQWQATTGLIGAELRTTVQRKPFTVTVVQPQALWIRISTGNERRIRRLRFGQALSTGIPVDDLTTAALQQFGSRHASYVIAILQELKRRGAL